MDGMTGLMEAVVKDALSACRNCATEARLIAWTELETSLAAVLIRLKTPAMLVACASILAVLAESIGVYDAALICGTGICASEGDAKDSDAKDAKVKALSIFSFILRFIGF
ncbi:hypothetical protein [Rhizobium sp. P32RR-XVIII]|uniref:hypothetical protein n=1 Tax=Rhizobium sp. P32RR-XVIII TaxID=2726738 RepID=UPI001FED5AD2|nr:hypothetical protein [Rhizobium sp. P32RR-XVIII]